MSCEVSEGCRPGGSAQPRGLEKRGQRRGAGLGQERKLTEMQRERKAF